MGEMTRALAKFLLVFGMVASVHQASTTCKNCVNLGKEEKAMFRAHSDACLASSGATPAQVEALRLGRLAAAPALRAHVYCVLLRCKLIGKDGKLQKAAALGKLAARPDGRNLTKVEALRLGRLAAAPALRAHVYCVLLRCKLIGKDGKLQKAAVLGKLAARPDGRNVTKVLENCSDHQQGDTPEELAWNLFRCGYDKKAILFDYMPTSE